LEDFIFITHTCRIHVKQGIFVGGGRAVEEERGNVTEGEEERNLSFLM
jgi:hypothetical protein